jgi:hypothetical protein
MKVVKYGVEITFPDNKEIDADKLHEILFHNSALMDCIINVYLENGEE